MDTYLKILAVVLCGCGAALFLGSSPMRHPMSLCCIAICGILMVELAPDVRELFERLVQTADGADALFLPVVKAVGIGILSQIGCGYCSDIGEKALGSMLEQGAVAAILVVSIPLFSAVLDVLSRLMEG